MYYCHSLARFNGAICRYMCEIFWNAQLNVCGLSGLSILPHQLLANLTDNCKPTAFKSKKKYRKQDKEFIATEVYRRPSEGIIESNMSTWHTQVVMNTK